mmetsp:Transcript_15029/g.42768  ORF Transcript_15029/g.42768 Transcript_15029/m.42768 type:complete len:241 (-) Transcript_15029:231-953(-)|eukprot:CAMPEP_0119121594 /NCGR_PEP_ID=MMETSP1310-20130426/2153_1 /TAXON_ID=464262 /ORGANISM="Genus nov. species nov., Strain RCC2339" /LENGTH=240 /DNA_ID=CAMNT_0007111165 /DNA_START=71 /DNA_END=793 /DNA_ORIENTATION=-
MSQLLGVSIVGYVYAIVALGSLALFAMLSSYLLLAVLALWVSLAFGVISLGYFGVLGLDERMMGKGRNGLLPLYAKVFFFPWTSAVFTVWKTRTITTSEPAYDEVYSGLYVGRRPVCERDVPADCKVVVDVTAEFSVADFVPRQYEYIACPSFDTMTPSSFATIHNAVESMLKKNDPILVHCAFGHGRSAMVAAAYLIRKGVAKDRLEAVRMMQQHRPRVHLNRMQAAKLDAYFGWMSSQ